MPISRGGRESRPCSAVSRRGFLSASPCLFFCTAKKKCTVAVHQRSFRPLTLLAGGGAKLRLKQAETAMRKREKRQRSERERERRENLCRSVRTPRESASCFFPRSESLSWTSVSLPSPPPFRPFHPPTYAAPHSTTHRPHMQSGIISRNAVAAAWSLF